MKEIPPKLLKVLKSHFKNNQRPFLLGITGAMAVGKTSFAQKLKLILGESWPSCRVSLVSLDGFFYPNTELARLGLSHKKGYPASFRLSDCREFLKDLATSQLKNFILPYYDQAIKDIHPTQVQKIPACDLYLIEGVALLFYLKLHECLWDQLILLDKDLNLIYQQFYTRFEQAFWLSCAKENSYFKDPLWQDPQERARRIKAIWSTVHLPFYQEWVIPAKAQADILLCP